jgi:putative peptidoglycan lipid II flippase
MTLLSRVLGFVRDFVIARVFGAGMMTDAFFVAFRLPNLLRRLFAEGAFSQAFVPMLAEYRNRRGDGETRQLVDRVATLLFVTVALVALLGIVGAPLLIHVSAPGFASDAGKFGLTVELARITFPYILFMALVALAAGIFNTWSRFALPAFTPVLLNLSMIGMALFAAPWFDPPVLALAWAVFIGGALQLAIQLPALRRLGMLPRWDWAPRDAGVRRMLTLMGPAVIGVSVAQVSLLINTIFASFLPSGSASWLYYAVRLLEFPAGLLGAALGTILLPQSGAMPRRRASPEFSALLDWGLRLTLMLTCRGAGAGDAGRTAARHAVPSWCVLRQRRTQTRSALVAYSIGLAGLILVKVLAPGFYARQDIRTPVRIAVVTLLATQAMNLAFIDWLKHAGLALSIGLASCLNAGLLFRGLRRADAYHPAPGWRPFLLKLGAALMLLAAVLWFATGEESSWLAMPFGERLARLSGTIAAGIVTYFLALFALGFRLGNFRRQA